MAREKTSAAKTSARALVDIRGQDIASGEFFEAPEAVIKSLVAIGAVDTNASEADCYPGKAPARKRWVAP